MSPDNSVCPPHGGSPKALEVSSFEGLLLCLGLRHGISLLANEDRREGMGDRDLA